MTDAELEAFEVHCANQARCDKFEQDRLLVAEMASRIAGGVIAACTHSATPSAESIASTAVSMAVMILNDINARGGKLMELDE